MSEQTAETTTPETTEAATQEAATDSQSVDTLPSWAREALSKANGEAAKYRTQVRELQPLAEKAREQEEASKTEQQRVAEAAAKAQQEAQEARSEALRYKAAATHGIGSDYFDLLGSGDEDTINSRGERLGTVLREHAAMKAELEALRAGKPAPANGRPVESLRPGATPENNQSEDDVLYNSLFGNPA